MNARHLENKTNTLFQIIQLTDNNRSKEMLTVKVLEIRAIFCKWHVCY